MCNINQISENHNIPVDQLKSYRGKESVTMARFICFNCLRTHTGSSLSKIGRVFGKDHATVLYGMNTYRDLRKQRYHKLMKAIDNCKCFDTNGQFIGCDSLSLPVTNQADNEKTNCNIRYFDGFSI